MQKNNFFSQNSTKEWALFITLAIIWGTSFILIKHGLKVYTPIELGAIRITVAGFVLLPFALQHLKKFNITNLYLLFLVALLANVIPAILFSLAQTKLNSGIAGILNSLAPIFAILISYLFFHGKITIANIIGIVISFFGTIILVISRSTNSVSINFYAFFIVLATLLYGINVNVIKTYLSHKKPFPISSVSLLLVLPVTISILFCTDFFSKLKNTEGAWEALGFISLLGFMSTAIATILFNKLIQISTPLFSSSVTYLIPVVAVIWGFVDGETLTYIHLIGMVIIVGGVYIANKKR
ncbi:MAG: DMT family transporter [Chitinophagaceae bacterium]|nr:DMT family transporter [Chitinophagaceae bacterium]